MSDVKLLAFRAAVHALPAAATVGESRTLRGIELPTLAVRPEEALGGFDVTFEELEATYGLDPRMFFEPDGSFVLRSHADQPNWQVDGLVFDRDGRVRYVELNGACPRERLVWLLTPLGWPQQPVMFQLLQEAVFLDEAAFHKYAVAGA